jgi:hypothetical protein
MHLVLRKIDCGPEGRFTVHSFLRAMRAVDDPKPAAQSLRIQAFFKQLHDFDAAGRGVLSEACLAEALKTPTATIRLYMDAPEVRRVVQYARERARDPSGSGISIELFERAVAGEHRLPWFLCQRTLRGNVGLLMAYEEWDDARSKDQVSGCTSHLAPAPFYTAKSDGETNPPGVRDTSLDVE